MRPWILRGLVFAAAMVVVRLFQGALINAWQTHAGLISLVLLVTFVIGTVVWGLRDGKADATANPDPDRRADLAMIWLLAGLLAGVLSGLVSWIISLFYSGIYTGGLFSEVTTFAAFTALTVFINAIIGVSVGRWRVDRKAPPIEKQSHDAAKERGDADVFSAVREDDSPTGEIPRQRGDAQTAQRTSSVATAERDEPTEVIRTGDADKTQVIRTGDHGARTDKIETSKDDAPTEVIRTDGPDKK